jgi:hypothetical protein
MFLCSQGITFKLISECLDTAHLNLTRGSVAFKAWSRKSGHLPDFYNAWPDAGQRPKKQDMSGEIRTSGNPTYSIHCWL